jgi:hypothetical protein
VRFVISCLVLALLSTPARADDAGTLPTEQQARDAIARGVAFLINDQNPDGSWGGAQNAVYTFTGPVWSNPETHRAWKVATTGLCVMALLEVGGSADARAILDKGIDYLIANADVKRPNEWDTMNSWAHIYALQALAEASTDPRYAQSPRGEAIRAAAAESFRLLAHFQSINGGWGYLETDPPRTRRPQWATSFTTASAVIAMAIARDRGLAVDEKVLARATRLVAGCRLVNGAFTYRVREIPNLHSEYIDRVKGSLCRIQVCHEALLRGGHPVPPEDLAWGVDRLFEDHRFLDIARNKPIPHENYYYNSGYFYLYGHYYAAMVIERLSAADRDKYWPMLRHEIIKLQQADGSMWDYDMHNYHKPYGTAFSLLALGLSLRGSTSIPEVESHSRTEPS